MLPGGQRGFKSHFLPPLYNTKGQRVPVSVMYVLYVSTCVDVLYVYVCVYVLYIYVCVCLCVCERVHAYMYMCLYVCM